MSNMTPKTLEHSSDQMPFLLREPALSATHLAFSYGNNIWISNRDGSGLRRLTSGGHESRPAFSPDGKQIAFVGEYGGPRGVFVVPVAGGEPCRLTYHPDDLGPVGFMRIVGDMVGWTPDGKHVLFSSRREAFAGGGFPVVKLFTVPAEGGAVTGLPLVRAAQGAFSPDATRIAYVPNVRLQPQWKRYRGGQATPIWIADLASSSIEARIPREESNDFNPMWVGDRIYFLSDRSGPVTLFSYDVHSCEVRQVLENRGRDIKSASACNDTIVYDQFGSLHLLDVRSGEGRALDIRPVADFPEVRPHFKNLADIVGTDSAAPEVKPKLSPAGDRAVFAVRGEILTVAARDSGVLNLTQTPGIVERDPAWSPDGKFIAYFSDESGEYALHICEEAARRVVVKIDLGDPPSFYYSPTWSPDGKKIAYLDKRLNYWYVDLHERTPVLVDTDLLVEPQRLDRLGNGASQMAWSPDSRWIAYTKVLASRYHAVFVHSVERRRSYQLTDGMSDALYVAFDKAGDYLYFTASTDTGLAGDWLAMSSFRRSARRAVYALLLQEGKAAPPLRRDAPEAPRSERVEIELDGISARVVRIPFAEGNYVGLFAAGPGTLFVVEGAPSDAWTLRRLQDIHKVDVYSGSAERILKDITYFDLSWDGRKMLYALGTQPRRRGWCIAAANGQPEASRESNPGLLRFDSMEVYVDPRGEWRHIYEQAWRVQRDFFYDPGLHGLDLEELKESYTIFLDNIVTRDDLDYLLSEALANLRVGHMWIDGPDAHRRHAKTGLLGADYCVDQGRYCFARIYGGDPWGPSGHGPLKQPGRVVRAGEYLLAVNGRDVRPTAEVLSYFEATAGRPLLLKVGPNPDGTGAREVTVIPVDSEYALRYSAWVESNRLRVDELTGARVAYVHVPNCHVAGYAAFTRSFFAQIGKDAAIIDARYNEGGYMPDYIIDCLRRQPLCYWHAREGRDWAAPSLTLFGPKVMLINEMSTSMGDVLPWAFRETGTGPLVGKRTWGGSIGIYSNPEDTLDHGFVGAPNLAFYTPDGTWEIENAGVPPDIEVDEDPRAARIGRDVQLDRAVEVVMGLLKERPSPSRPPRPAYPNYKHE